MTCFLQFCMCSHNHIHSFYTEYPCLGVCLNNRCMHGYITNFFMVYTIWHCIKKNIYSHVYMYIFLCIAWAMWRNAYCIDLEHLYTINIHVDMTISITCSTDIKLPVIDITPSVNSIYSTVMIMSLFIHLHKCGKNCKTRNTSILYSSKHLYVG